MSGIRTTTGLFSGIDFGTLTDQLIEVARAPAKRIETRIKDFNTVKSGVETLEANVLGLSASVSQLSSRTIFDSTKVTNSDPNQVFVNADSTAQVGNYGFKVVQLASAEQKLSKGFANSDKQLVGEGTITISQGSELGTATRLSNLNGGAGVQRGSIRITDRSGATTTIDLSTAYSVDDVLAAINEQSDVSVTARADGGHLVLEDTSGSTTSNLIVQDIGTGKTAADLGLRKSVSGTTLTGNEVHYLTGDFSFDQINDGNRLSNVDSQNDLRITLADSSQIDINFDTLSNLNDLVNAVNNHASNSGKLTAALTNGRLVLTDNTTGSGSLGVANLNGAEVVNALGLDNAVVGNVLTGDKLLAGIGSRLLRNLRGGRGITTPGQVSLTDRNGLSATIDLTQAQSLDEVISAINSANNGGTKLALTARLNKLGTGIEIVDTSGATTSNLIVADVGGGSVAADLGVAVNLATTSVASGSLGLRHVNEATLLDKYAPDGGDVERGSFLIIDSAGNQASISVSSSVKTVGDLLQRINATTQVQVRAELNSTGDGFQIVDEAGGTGTLTIQEVTGHSAEDLRILGSATTQSGSQLISSRLQTKIDVSATDTLATLTAKINASSKDLTAGVLRDGSAFNPYHLQLTSKATGSDGKFVIDTGSIELGFAVTSNAEDALLQVGNSTASSYIVASSDNQFDDVATGVNATAKTVGTSISQVNVAQNTDTAKQALKSFVQAFNSYIDKSAALSKFDPDATKRGPLQGQSIVLRIQTRLTSALTRTYFGATNSVKSMSDLGIRVSAGGKINFDEALYDKMATQDPAAIKEFFVNTTNGAGKNINAALNSLTDTTNGIFKAQKTTLQNNITNLQDRVDQIDGLLVTRKERLLRQFIKMESTIGKVQSQQSALTAFSAKSG